MKTRIKQLIIEQQNIVIKLEAELVLCLRLKHTAQHVVLKAVIDSHNKFISELESLL